MATKSVNKLNNKSATTYIYGLFVSEKCLYIGQTNSPTRRKEQHLDSIRKKKHKVKKLNTIPYEEVEFKVLCEIHTDNSLIICLTESCWNSIYKPLNKCTWMSFRSTCTFARISPDLATLLIDLVVQYYGGCRMDLG